MPSDGAEPASQAAPGTLGQWNADAELADRPSAEARPTRTNASDPRAAQGDAPRAAPETLAGAVGQTASNRSDSALLESSPKPVADRAEPEGRSSAGAAEPGPEADGPAPTLRPAAAATPSGIAAGAPRIEASVEIGDGAPGRTERTPGETPGPAGRPLPPAPAPVVQLGIHVASAASRRVERLVVQLEPAALGRVEVRLDFTHDNRVSAVVAAERPETLEVLQRDSRALERGLQDAGLRLDQNALSFSLRQEQRGQERGAGTPDAWPVFEASTGSESGAGRPGDARPAYWIGAHRVLDIRI
jgi:flagellar hook-length control protein FliK